LSYLQNDIKTFILPQSKNHNLKV